MPAAAASDPFGLVGSVVDRQFRVDAMVGEGGFGVVYRGWHLSLEQPVAIKALKMPEAREAGTQGALLAKFREEAKITYVLSQSTLNVVRTIDFGATHSPTGAWVPFAVQEWLEGETLAHDLRRRRQQGLRGRSLPETMKLMEPAVTALAIAHQKRVVHRDVKPGNFFLMAPGAAGGVTLKVLDFGIAKVMREGTLSGAASTGMVSFTPRYAAPEQVESRYGPTGPWTDVYGLGLVMIELLGDRAPIEGDDLALILGQIIDPQRRPTPRARGLAVPDALEAVLARALSVDPRSRQADAGELWSALLVAAASPVALYPTPPPGSVPAYQRDPSLAYPLLATPPPMAAPQLMPQPPTGHALLGPMPGHPAPTAPPPSMPGPRSTTLVALLVGTGLGLLFLVAFATWIVTRR